MSELIFGRSPARQDLQATQISQVITANPDTRAAVVFESDALFEAPNWSPDGASLVMNSAGSLYELTLANGALRRIDTGSVDRVNNDHILSADGRTVFFSAAGHLYSVPIEGGQPFRISNDPLVQTGYTYWLHGISPDGAMLAYVGAIMIAGENALRTTNLALIPAVGGDDLFLTTGEVPHDGPEYSPDGQWNYYNGEEAATRPGHAQIFRMRPDGSGHEQLTFDDRVNWFPHLDPAGERALYISYELGTTSHPADVEVQLRMMPAGGGDTVEVISLFGGQGTLNVNSWSPDGARFAYVAYPTPQTGGGIDRWSSYC